MLPSHDSGQKIQICFRFFIQLKTSKPDSQYRLFWAPFFKVFKVTHSTHCCCYKGVGMTSSLVENSHFWGSESQSLSELLNQVEWRCPHEDILREKYILQ